MTLEELDDLLVHAAALGIPAIVVDPCSFVKLYDREIGKTVPMNGQQTVLFKGVTVAMQTEHPVTDPAVWADPIQMQKTFTVSIKASQYLRAEGPHKVAEILFRQLVMTVAREINMDGPLL